MGEWTEKDDERMNEWKNETEWPEDELIVREMLKGLRSIGSSGHHSHEAVVKALLKDWDYSSTCYTMDSEGASYVLIAQLHLVKINAPAETASEAPGSTQAETGTLGPISGKSPG